MTPQPEDLQNLHILVVDDNATNRLILREQLKFWGCRVMEAENSLTALTLLRRARQAGDPVQVALLDMLMPEMDGESLGRLIKADAELQETILIMLTSAGDRTERQRLQEIGFADYFSKPLKPSQLRQCLLSVRGPSARSQVGRVTSAAAGDVLPPALKPRRVLVAEDNVVNQKLAKRILEKLGCYVDVVANGLEAVQAAGELPYDLVFMDMQMPEMDGLEATATIRAQEQGTGRHLPIIALTANAMQGDRELCLEAGMDWYLPKPIHPKEVVKAMNLVLSNVRTAEAMPGNPQVLDLDGVLAGLAGDREMLTIMMETFLQNAASQVQDLHLALEDGDAGQAQTLVQSVRRAAANLGARALQAAVLRLEEACAQRDGGAPEPLLGDIDRELVRLQEAWGEMHQ